MATAKRPIVACRLFAKILKQNVVENKNINIVAQLIDFDEGCFSFFGAAKAELEKLEHIPTIHIRK